MAVDLEDLERLTKLAALAQQAALEIMNFINNKRAQGGKTKDEILDHAQQVNDEARKVIEAL